MNRQDLHRSTPRKALFVFLGLASLCTAVAGQTLREVTEEDFVGTWAGRFVGVGSGAFETTIGRDAEGKLTCSIWIKDDAPEVEAATLPCTSARFADGKFTSTFLDASGMAEIRTVATTEGLSIEGAYAARALEDGTEVDRGTFTGTKLPATPKR
jgi:hypothetical protein